MPTRRLSDAGPRRTHPPARPGDRAATAPSAVFRSRRLPLGGGRGCAAVMFWPSPPGSPWSRIRSAASPSPRSPTIERAAEPPPTVGAPRRRSTARPRPRRSRRHSSTAGRDGEGQRRQRSIRPRAMRPRASSSGCPRPGAKLAPAPDKRLVERSRHGVVPKIGAGWRQAVRRLRPPGARRLGAAQGRPHRHRRGRAGPGQRHTAEAIAKLPPAVTLAFAPLRRGSGEAGGPRARRRPRGPAPGADGAVRLPATTIPARIRSTANGQAAETMDRLHWVMSRFPGYVGVMNYMGGQVHRERERAHPGAARARRPRPAWSSTTALGAQRRSGPGRRLGAARGQGRRGDRHHAQGHGHRRAARAARGARPRARASRIGAASSLPVTIDRLAAWAKGLEAKGIQLVPVSAALAAARGGVMAKRCAPGAVRAIRPHRATGFHARPQAVHDPAQGRLRRRPALPPLRRRDADQSAPRCSSAAHRRPRACRPPTPGRCRRAASTRARTPRRRRCASCTRRRTSPRSRCWPRRRSWFTYDLPPDLAGQAWKGRYRGQTQKWFALRFEGEESEIDIARPGGGAPAGVRAWRWERMERLPELIIPFKRPVYERIVAEFAHLAG